ncbi:MAG: trigger factor [Proteobacteria bacterium]|nr:trigger factor [Pseudomonadota bacterium]
MKSEVETIDTVRKKIRVTIPEDRVKQEFDTAYRNVAKKVKIKGFRPGKAPRSVVSSYYKDQIYQEVIIKLIQDSLPKVTTEEGMIVVSEPSIENSPLEEGKEFTYTATFEVKPVIEVKEYQGLEAISDKLEITPEKAEERLKAIQASHASLKSIEGEDAITEGIFAVIDFQGFSEGKPLEGGKVVGHLLEVRTGSFIPGFCEQLVGMKKGEEREFVLDFPSDYERREFAGKKVTFQVKVNDLKEKIIPLLNDDFAKDLGEFNNLEDLKKKVMDTLEAEEKERIKNQLQNDLISSLIERNLFDLPPSLITREIAYMIAETERDLSFQGLSLEKLRISPDELREKYREKAERRVRASLLLEAISKQEGITVQEDEIEERLKLIADRTHQEVEKIKAYYQREKRIESLTTQLLEEKALDFLAEKAKINIRD